MKKKIILFIKKKKKEIIKDNRLIAFYDDIIRIFILLFFGCIMVIQSFILINNDYLDIFQYGLFLQAHLFDKYTENEDLSNKDLTKFIFLGLWLYFLFILLLFYFFGGDVINVF